MKQIFLKIQQRLAGGVPALQYVDRNWGQLNYEQPNVKWPCALIDMEAVEYEQLSAGALTARATISVTLADQVLTRSSAEAPSPADAYGIVDVVELTCHALSGFASSESGSAFQPLVLERMSHQYTDRSFDVYKLTFSTAFTVFSPPGNGTTLRTVRVI